MTYFLQQVVDGLASGATYALIALGFTVIFGIMGVLNMAQAAMIMIGPLTCVALLGVGVVSFPVLFVAAILAAALLALVIERVALRPFVQLLRVSRASDADHLAPFIATLGVYIVCENAAAMYFGTRAIPFEARPDGGNLELFGSFVGQMQVVVFVVAVVLVGGLELMLRRTTLGLWMRATADNPRAASAAGVRIGVVLSTSTVIAAVLGAAGGVLVAAMDTVASPFMGLDYGLKSLVVMIVGGLGSLHGALVAGVLLGLLEAMTIGYLSSSLRDLVAFGMLIAVLLVRPRGLFPTARTV